MKRDDQGGEGYIGQPLPGTGGDLRRDDDVEGHRARGNEDDGFLARDGGESLRRDGGESLRRDGGEGLFRSGPSTQGEIMQRGPGDNPHADR